MDKPGMNPQMGMDMMKKMMGGDEGGGPMQMCKDMTSSIKKAASLAAFATPELHALFSEWLEGKEKEVLNTLARSGKHDHAGIAKALKLTPELLARMAAEGKLTFEVKSTGSASKPSTKGKAKHAAKKAAKKKVSSKKKAVRKKKTARRAGK